jgi:hypothetical protein
MASKAPYKFIWVGDIYGPKPYKSIRIGDIYGPKPYEFIGFAASGMGPFAPTPGRRSQGVVQVGMYEAVPFVFCGPGEAVGTIR